MATFYLIRGNQIIAEIETGSGDITALPLLQVSEEPLSLLNAQHVQALMASQGWAVEQALEALGLADLRSTMLKSIVVGSDPTSVAASGIVAYRLIQIDAYSIWQCDGQQSDLLQLHAAMWAKAPTETLGLLAVVQVFGSAFYTTAVRTATGQTAQQALERRDRIASYLEGEGYENTVALREATNEHAQMVGIATALGYSEAQLWAAMHG